MSKLQQSIGEMLGAVLHRLDCRLCPCTEMDRDGVPYQTFVFLLEEFTRPEQPIEIGRDVTTPVMG